MSRTKSCTLPRKGRSQTGRRFFAASYDAMIGGAERAGLRERRQRLLKDLTGEVLEIGAGTGLNVPHYESASRLVLLDPNPHMRRRLERRLDQTAAPATVLPGVAEALPFPDESFDAVVCTLVLCSVDDAARALGEVHRVLRPDGQLVLIEHVRSAGAHGWFQDVLGPVHARLGAGCRPNRPTGELVRAAGFDLEADAFALRGNLDPLTRTGLAGVARKRSTVIRTGSGAPADTRSPARAIPTTTSDAATAL